MPRVRRKPIPRRPVYDEDRRLQLLTGFDGFGTAYGGGFRQKPFDAESAKADWLEHGTELLSEWAIEHPFSRPWAWWQFDAPEPLGCMDHPDVIHGHKPLPRDDWLLPYESERAYLTRLNLLQSGELGK